jgi:hypothetical protein
LLPDLGKTQVDVTSQTRRAASSKVKPRTGSESHMLKPQTRVALSSRASATCNFLRVLAYQTPSTHSESFSNRF